MKTRGGFISIICLIVMSVMMVMILYLESTTGLQHLILNSTSNNIQSYYLAEGKIYMVLNEDKYYLNQLYPILTEYFRTVPFSKPPKNILIDEEDLELEDKMDKVKVVIVDRENKKELILVAKSDFNGLRTTIEASVKLFNKFFEMEVPILDTSLIEDEYKEELNDLLLNISENINIKDCNKSKNIYGMESIDFNNIILDRGSNGFVISAYRDAMVVPYVEKFNEKEIFIISKSFGEYLTNLFIGDTDTKKEVIKLSGVIYVEGNIIISKDFQFNGIIIVKDGDIRINNDVRVDIKGMVILDNIINNDFLKNSNILYSRHSVYKYGTYLPGFIETKIDLIKRN
ncbi:hypothetical protein [Tissierella praeacuta]|uniref:hypothetical protein n=1 Tax=Tissierella praeacuta TaxID=43131 RepID=UPI00333EBBAC